MAFRQGTGSANSAGTGRILQAGATDLEVWVAVYPGSPDFYLGGTDLVDEYTGFRMTEGMQLHFDLRTGDELWIRGTDAVTSSIAQTIIRTSNIPD